MPMGRPKLRIKSEVTALLTKGIKYKQIAAMLGCSAQTVRRIADEVLPGIEQADSKLAVLTREVQQVINVKTRAARYAELATSAKNEAVSLGALTRIDDLEGIVTEKERLRLKQAEQKAYQPMFMLPAGTSVSVTVMPASETERAETQRVIDITPEVDHKE